MRKNGWSYNLISQRLGLAKSTLSDWLKNIPYEPNEEVRMRIKNGPAKSVTVRNQKRMLLSEQINEIAESEINGLSERDLWLVGLGLYIGEGSKTQETVKVVNSDPNVIRLTMYWFKCSLKLSDQNLSLRIHVYPDTNIEAAFEYWMKVTNLPRDAFQGISIDRRTTKLRLNHGKLPYGTLHVSVRCKGDREKGVLLHRRIMGWLQSIYRHTRA